eukprot:TRINITY_DN14150_c1_g1_i1.p1 TRINITY_DN14150_c1_g1~~TRINITY_DN14150_c1_g1_i1.p1  ORF type:complete len:291 (+),score=41.81 TRINITY_DN14150_c1_g1_i1:79-951(+)
MAESLPPYLGDIMMSYIKHDIPSLDVGGAVVGSGKKTAVFFVKSELVLAGKPFVDALFNKLSCSVEWIVEEGIRLKGSSKNKIEVGYVRGPANRILQGERTALEILTRCSSVALEMRKAVEIAKSENWSGVIAGTRKTTPGTFRLIEKYGMLIGGGDSHRYSLSGMTMLKDNHIDACGSITSAVKSAKKVGGFALKVEVEARTPSDVEEACIAGADVVMLDNFTPALLREHAQKLKAKFPSVLFEVSGGITHATLRNFLIPGLDVLSMGCLTHGPPAVDISLKIRNDAKL